MRSAPGRALLRADQRHRGGRSPPHLPML